MAKVNVKFCLCEYCCYKNKDIENLKECIYTSKQCLVNEFEEINFLKIRFSKYPTVIKEKVTELVNDRNFKIK